MGNCWSRTRRRDKDTQVSFRYRSRGRSCDLQRDVYEVSPEVFDTLSSNSSSDQEPQSQQGDPRGESSKSTIHDPGSE